MEDLEGLLEVKFIEGQVDYLEERILAQQFLIIMQDRKDRAFTE